MSTPSQPPVSGDTSPAGNSVDNAAVEYDDLPEQMRVRRDKRSQLLADGVAPYPVNVARTISLRELRQRFIGLACDTASGQTVSVVGRITLLRNSGKLCFATVQEGDGTTAQLMISLVKVGEQALARWKTQVDIGDFIGVTGEVISSKRGELSVLAEKWTMASKALRPLPAPHNPTISGFDSAAGSSRYGSCPLRRTAKYAGFFPRTRLHRGGDADVANPARRRDGTTIHHPHQRL
jgi:hypothetical protein